DHLYKNRAMLKRDYQLAQAEGSRARNQVNMLTQRLIFLGCDKGMLDKVVSTGKIVGNIRITAPIHGVVTYRDVAVGEVVQPDRVIFTISDMSTVMLRVDLPESDLSRVKLGDRVRIRLASYPGELFQGVVSYISVIVDEMTRTVAVRARLENEKGILKKFMFAEIELEGTPQVVLACPKEAVQEHGGEKVVFVKTAEGFEERRVVVGFEGERYAQVKAGLTEGEVVATQGSLMLKTEITYQH
ncbi:MAG: efflux RND transporter periplasmic adaptor subunit, partial [Candidatus Obscuribacterales bacterium]|nr:efflux RND transporter periplasmic adaptor subunit [Candidatus Obscuribacterales bacterium]